MAVSIDPNIKINKIDDLKKYKIGTFQKFSTTNTLMKEIITSKELNPIKYTDITQALKNRDIEVGIMTPDYAYDLRGKGGHILYKFENSFNEYLFTGLIICDNLDMKYDKSIKYFLSSIKESINFIKKNKDLALKEFKKEFPDVLNHEEMFDYLITLWNKNLNISNKSLSRSKHTCQKVYPWLLKASTPQFIVPRNEDKIIKILNSKNISRDIPFMEDLMAENISEYIKNKKPINLLGFWGASDKKYIDKHDASALNKFVEINKQIKKVYEPGINFTFILSDEHTRLNKCDIKNYSNYLKQIIKETRKLGFKTIKLSKLWKKYDINDKLLNKKIKNFSNKQWNDLKYKKELEKSAKNREFKDFKKEAKRYYVTRKIESEIIEKEYPKTIFHTYSEDIFQSLFPNLPSYLWV